MSYLNCNRHPSGMGGNRILLPKERKDGVHSEMVSEASWQSKNKNNIHRNPTKTETLKRGGTTTKEYK